MKEGRRQLYRLLVVVLIVALMPVAGLPARAAAPADVFFSEYIEGSSYNKALEIYNGTGAAINLADGQYRILMYFNGSTASTLMIDLTGTVADGDVYVVTNASAVQAIKDQADQITAATNWYNGDDAVVLAKGGTIVDVIGQIGFDPGTQWGVDPASTADNTIRRKAEICAGDTDGTNPFDPALEWDGFANDTFDGLGAHTAACDGAVQEPKINEFSASTTGTDVEYVEV
ncbi:MAG TPA: lamin tail domain-containing protein, partial [Anaerolineae bacterium]|nr:lamin tail domain-containing protein [Anaerolineae bacterium]